MKFLQWIFAIIGIDLLLLLLLKIFKEEVYYEKNEENINYDSDIEIRKMSYNDWLSKLKLLWDKQSKLN